MKALAPLGDMAGRGVLGSTLWGAGCSGREGSMRSRLKASRSAGAGAGLAEPPPEAWVAAGAGGGSGVGTVGTGAGASGGVALAAAGATATSAAALARAAAGRGLPAFDASSGLILRWSSSRSSSEPLSRRRPRPAAAAWPPVPVPAAAAARRWRRLASTSCLVVLLMPSLVSALSTSSSWLHRLARTAGLGLGLGLGLASAPAVAAVSDSPTVAAVLSLLGSSERLSVELEDRPRGLGRAARGVVAAAAASSCVLQSRMWREMARAEGLVVGERGDTGAVAGLASASSITEVMSELRSRGAARVLRGPAGAAAVGFGSPGLGEVRVRLEGAPPEVRGELGLEGGLVSGAWGGRTAGACSGSVSRWEEVLRVLVRADLRVMSIRSGTAGQSKATFLGDLGWEVTSSGSDTALPDAAAGWLAGCADLAPSLPLLALLAEESLFGLYLAAVLSYPCKQTLGVSFLWNGSRRQSYYTLRDMAQRRPRLRDICMHIDA
jgi:hypothetical protein